MTRTERHIRKEYTRDRGGVCCLRVGVQTFQIECGARTHKQAAWVRDMLAVALAKMMEMEKPA